MFVIRESSCVPPQYKDIEIVERKGFGHPDTLIDLIVEEFSINLCKAYIDKFGFIAHHNVDKGLIVGGSSEPDFKGGKLIKKPLIYIAGRATSKWKDKTLDIEEIAIKSAKSVLSNLINANAEKDFDFIINVKEGSKDLTELFSRGKIPLANDTSFGVGFAPLSKLERTVKELELFLNSKEIKRKYPFIGEDIKIMGLRQGEKVNLTIAIAFVGRYIDNLSDYWDKKAKIEEICRKKAKLIYGSEIDLKVNTADKGESIYLTVIGSSIEAGDDGSVGRGNRANGLITPFRPMSLEATAGKNPVSHIGKIYSVCANLIAEDVYKETGFLNNVYLLSRIGQEITKPKIALVETYGKATNEGKIKDILTYHLEMLPELTYKIIEKKIAVVY
jgi:S-adenosylmethionine synthetase